MNVIAKKKISQQCTPVNTDLPGGNHTNLNSNTHASPPLGGVLSGRTWFFHPKARLREIHRMFVSFILYKAMQKKRFAHFWMSLLLLLLENTEVSTSDTKKKA